MKTLRDLMIDRIKRYGWLDYDYAGEKSELKYLDWLTSLSDDEFLSAYDRVQILEGELD